MAHPATFDLGLAMKSIDSMYENVFEPIVDGKINGLADGAKKAMAALSAAKGEADNIGAGADGAAAGPGIDFTSGEAVKRALELPVSGLNIYEQYENRLHNLKDVFGEAAKDSLKFQNAVTDLNAELLKTEAGKVAEVVNNSASPLEKFKAEMAELDKFKMKGLITDVQYDAALGKDFKGLGADLAPPKVEHPGAALEGSTEAYNSILNFEDQGKGGDIQEQIAAKIDMLVQQQARAAQVNQQVADAINRIFKRGV
jgi:hypothetical protein